MTTFKENILARHAGGPNSVTYYVLAATADLRDAVANARAEIGRDTSLSDVGRQTAFRHWVSENAAPALYRARRTAAACQARIDAERKTLTWPMPDKSDLAGAILRSDLRAMLRNMPQADQTIALADPMFRAAALEAPRIASGLSNENWDRLMDSEIERLHGPRRAELDRLEEDAKVLDMAQFMVTNDVSNLGGFGDTNAVDTFIDESVTAKMPALNEQVAIQTADFAKAA